MDERLGRNRFQVLGEEESTGGGSHDINGTESSEIPRSQDHLTRRAPWDVQNYSRAYGGEAGWLQPCGGQCKVIHLFEGEEAMK